MSSATDLIGPSSSHVSPLTNNYTSNFMPSLRKGGANPYLRILVEPERKFTFRYRSECQNGSHGCLQALSSNSRCSRKMYPTIELVNYTGTAKIKCRLWQNDKDEEHPFRVCEADTSEDAYLSTLVTQDDGYIVEFKGIRIICMDKDDVRTWLLKKLEKISLNVDMSQLNNALKTINLHVVRLRFSAHDVASDEEICPPIYSQPIGSKKSNKTNDLKICKYSLYSGRPRGGEDVFLFVEKVNKKDIKVQFFELNENGDRIWTEFARFLETDVHHQYAIVIKTPPYEDLRIASKVKVYMELVRPSDGRTSEPREFVYTPTPKRNFEPNQAQPKRQKLYDHSVLSSPAYSTGGSIHSMGNISTTSTETFQTVPVDRGLKKSEDTEMRVPQYSTAISESSKGYNFYMSEEELQQQHNYDADESLAVSYENRSDFDSWLADPLPSTYDEPTSNNLAHNADIDRHRSVVLLNNPMICGNITYPVAVRTQPQPPPVDHNEFFENVFTECFGEDLMTDQDFQFNLSADSGSIKETISLQIYPEEKKARINEENKIDKELRYQEDKECPVYYKTEDAVEVKKLIKDLCGILNHRDRIKTEEIKHKLESLLEIRLLNGDTFLHMALRNSQPSLKYLVKLIHSMKMPHLLNLTNDLQQTILHLALVCDMPRLVAFLIAKGTSSVLVTYDMVSLTGCDPMLRDADSNNALHHAVAHRTLSPLLQAIVNNQVTYDLNDQNNEKQTPLHLAAIFDSGDSAKLLLEHGADCHARDYQGRTPLHLAIYDGNLNAARAIIEYMLPTDPFKYEDHNEPALKLAQSNPQIWEIVKKHITADISSHDTDDTNSSEDEFVSADEGD